MDIINISDRKKILLADDSATIRKVIELTFADEGIDVYSVADGDAAMKKFVEVEPDLVLADVNMPGMSGFEAVEKIREIDQKTKIVILTANIQVSSRERAEQLAVHFVQKPATLAAVQLAIDYFLAAA